MVNIGLFPKKSQEEKDLKSLNKIKELKEKTKSEYLKISIMKRRIKNSKVFSNIKDVGDDGLIELKSGEYASLIEVKAIDLSLSSKQEKINFFNYYRSLFHIKNLNLKFYKLDEPINLNNNKLNLDRLIKKFKNDLKRLFLLNESRNLIDELEQNNFTVSSIYYIVLIAKDTDTLERQLDEVEDLFANIQPRLNIEIITNRLEVYKFLSNLYLSDNPLDLLRWSKIEELIVPLNLVERTNMLKIDDNEVQLLTIKNIAPFVD